MLSLLKQSRVLNRRMPECFRECEPQTEAGPSEPNTPSCFTGVMPSTAVHSLGFPLLGKQLRQDKGLCNGASEPAK